ncbi:MAG: hypothetical protein ABI353_13340 [Isosphaeraceae bacterium]
MARPANRAKNQVDPFSLYKGMVIDEVRLKPPEDDAEKSHRLWKDRWSFIIKELLVYIIASLIVIGAALYSFWVLAHPGLSDHERQGAVSILASLGTAVAGFMFGKGTK